MGGIGRGVGVEGKTSQRHPDVAIAAVAMNHQRRGLLTSGGGDHRHGEGLNPRHRNRDGICDDGSPEGGGVRTFDCHGGDVQLAEHAGARVGHAEGA